MKSIHAPPSKEKLISRIHGGDREAVAQYVMTLEPLIRRRISGKLGPRMRRVFDSQDIFSTVLRRVEAVCEVVDFFDAREGKKRELPPVGDNL